MKIMNIYKSNINYLINTNNFIKKKKIISYNLPLNIIQLFFEKKKINIDKLKITYLFLLTMGIITYNRYIL